MVDETKADDAEAKDPEASDTEDNGEPSDEYKAVLQLVADGKVTPEQAERLLRLMDKDPQGADDDLIGRPMQDIERDVIRQTIERCGGDVFQAAQMLRVPVHTLYRKLGQSPPREGAGGRRGDARRNARERAREAAGRGRRARHHRDRARDRARRHRDDARQQMKHSVKHAVDEALGRAREHVRDEARQWGDWGQDFEQHFSGAFENFMKDFGKEFGSFGQQFANAFSDDDERTAATTQTAGAQAWDAPSTGVAVKLDEGAVRLSRSGDGRVHASREARSQSDGPNLNLKFDGEGDVEIRLPDGLLVAARTGDGSIEIGDLDVSQAELTAGDGHIELRGVRGQADLTTGDGSVRVNDSEIADLSVNTGDGGIDVSGASGKVSLNTGDGSVRLSDSDGTIDVKTGDGGIDLHELSTAVEESPLRRFRIPQFRLVYLRP